MPGLLTKFFDLRHFVYESLACVTIVGYHWLPCAWYGSLIVNSKWVGPLEDWLQCSSSASLRKNSPRPSRLIDRAPVEQGVWKDPESGFHYLYYRCDRSALVSCLHWLPPGLFWLLIDQFLTFSFLALRWKFLAQRTELASRFTTARIVVSSWPVNLADNG